VTEVTSKVIVRMRHVRAEEVCASALLEFWQRHNWDMGDFCKNGIEADKLEATGDPVAIQVAKRARAERG
jgi:hypothetical protein